MECLENVIKLSNTECECFSAEKPDDYNEGQSNVVLDELEGLNLRMISGAENCEEGGLWNLMAKSRTNAEQAFKADLLSCLESKYMPKRENYSGLLGQRTFNASLSISDPVAGQVLKFPRIVGGKIKIKRIGLIMSATTTVTINVYDNADYATTPLGTYSINSVANDVAFGSLVTPLELPMWSNTESNLEYYFVYTISGFQPKNNKTECLPCSGGVKQVVWANWLKVKGIKGTGTDYANFSQTDEINGIILDADLTCDSTRVICSAEHPIDFNTGKGLYIAYSIRSKAGARLAGEILA